MPRIPSRWTGSWLSGAKLKGEESQCLDEEVKLVVTCWKADKKGIISTIWEMMEFAVHHRDICAILSSINGNKMFSEGEGWMAKMVKASNVRGPHSHVEKVVEQGGLGKTLYSVFLHWI